MLNIKNIELKYGFCKKSPWKAFPGRQDRKQISLFVFWEKLWHDNFVSISTYLYFFMLEAKKWSFSE